MPVSSQDVSIPNTNFGACRQFCRLIIDRFKKNHKLNSMLGVVHIQHDDYGNNFFLELKNL
ncbi:hypothetical protein DERF_013793 [Dermatophagoides farinae]|uniref:Uncharacterized protein n=1 Tax=Dermatophagoides farinae TaxID=6954 RepID=A0A922HQH3_DERFA|nr:hypothetical protein DERF_013793 [Dermatophagoides farinae]